MTLSIRQKSACRKDLISLEWRKSKNYSASWRVGFNNCVGQGCDKRLQCWWLAKVVSLVNSNSAAALMAEEPVTSELLSDTNREK